MEELGYWFYDPELDHRRSIRLKGYDYSQGGAYFVTICAYNRKCLFGRVMNGEMQLNEAGQLARTVWVGLPDHYSDVKLDAWVIMPNHLHGIVVLVGAGFKPAPDGNVDGKFGAGFKPAPTRHGLSEIVRAFKTFSARRINEMRRTPGVPVWQRNFYEHIIRDDESLLRIRQYIADNAALWGKDAQNRASIG